MTASRSDGCSTAAWHQLTWNEDRFGSLDVGKVADMVVLAEDPLTCDLDRLKDVRIERTFLGGRQVFGPT